MIWNHLARLAQRNGESRLRPEVGAVGAKLYFGNDTIQHAGVDAGNRTGAGHPTISVANKNLASWRGSMSSVQLFGGQPPPVWCATKSVYEAGGLDEKNLAIAFSDVDLCLNFALAVMEVLTP